MSPRNLNQVDLIGNLSKDPELRQTNSGSSVTSITLATNRSWNNSKGEQQEETEWHDVIFFGKLAEIVCQILRKSDKIHVEGRVHSRTYTNDAGQDIKRVEIIASNFILLDRHPSNKKHQNYDQNQIIHDENFTDYNSIA